MQLLQGENIPLLPTKGWRFHLPLCHMHFVWSIKTPDVASGKHCLARRYGKLMLTMKTAVSKLKFSEMTKLGNSWCFLTYLPLNPFENSYFP